jgi:TRAP-type C4-dicarboxylate transport system permease small subunit
MTGPSQFWPRTIVSIARWGAWAGGIIILLSTLLICVDVLTRSMFGMSLVESFELSSYGLAIALGLALPHSLLTGGHIRINVTRSVKLPLLRQVADVAAFGSMAVFAGCVAWYGVMTVRESLASSVVSNSTLGIPLAIPQSIWAAGLVAFAGVSVFAVIRSVVWICSHRDGDIELAATIPDDDAAPAGKREHE